MIKEIKEVLFTEEQIQERIKELGKEISEYYQGKNLVVVGVLKGAAPFMMDLIKQISIPLQFDFIQVKSYEGTESGNITFKKGLDLNIKGMDILFVDDIIDTAKSSTFILEHFKNSEANSIEFACLLDKRENRKYDYNAKWTGFIIPNHFVIGYGLDYNERFRELKYIGIFDTKYC